MLAIAMWAATPGARADAEHERIEQARAAVNARYEQRRRECAARFVAAPCLESARKERHDELSRLRQEQLQLDDAARRAAADARRTEIESKVTAARAAARTTPPEVELMPPKVASPPAPKHLFPPPGSLPRAAPLGAGAEREHTASFEARAREAAEHRAKVEQRNAERSARGKVAAPLPLPEPGSSAAQPPGALAR